VTLASVLALGAPALAQEPPNEVASADALAVPVVVRYVTATTVYLDAGRAEGLSVGTRLRVVRAGAVLAELEVDYLAEHSASCRLLGPAASAIVAGDRVEVVSLPGAATGPPAPATEPEAPAAPEIAAPAAAGIPVPYRDSSEPPLHTVASGSIALGFRTLADDLGPTSEETNARISLRLRDIGGLPWSLRVRARSRETTREGYGASVPETQSSDRLYELALAWAPPEGRFRFQLGRLYAGEYASLGPLDGALGEVRIGGGFSTGVFAGSRPELGELGFDTGGEKYGGFVRWVRDRSRGPVYAELLLGGATERDDAGEASRDYVAIESRFGSGPRWWLSQRAEIDLNRGWREEVAGSSSQVTNAAIAASLRLSEAWRATLAYDQRRNYLTAETRPRPEEVFTRYLREGARLGFDWRTRGDWSGTFGVGSERADALDDATDSAWLSVVDGRVLGSPLSLGADGSFYSGGTAEGWVAGLRGRWAFRAGHEVGLALGASEARVGEEWSLSPRSNQWARLHLQLELPASLWLYGEYELATGDDFEGDRAYVEVGYRF
jgi:hypothetical protein